MNIFLRTTIIVYLLCASPVFANHFENIVRVDLDFMYGTETTNGILVGKNQAYKDCWSPKVTHVLIAKSDIYGSGGLFRLGRIKISGDVIYLQQHRIECFMIFNDKDKEFALVPLNKRVNITNPMPTFQGLACQDKKQLNGASLLIRFSKGNASRTYRKVSYQERKNLRLQSSDVTLPIFKQASKASEPVIIGLTYYSSKDGAVKPWIFDEWDARHIRYHVETEKAYIVPRD